MKTLPSSILRKIAFIMAITTFYTLSSNAEKNTPSLSTKDVKEIKYAIDNILESHRGLFQEAATSNNISVAVKNSLSQIYLSSEVQIETDVDATTKKSGNEKKTVQEYLYDFQNYFRPDEVDEAIILTSNWDEKIYMGDKQPHTYVEFTQLLKGKDKNGKRFSSVFRVADIQLEKSGKVWHALISEISFADKYANHKNLTEIPIVDGYNIDEIVEETYSDQYFNARFDQGDYFLKNEDYGKAYIYLSEARKCKGNKEISAKAEDKMTDLKAKVRAETNDNDWEDYIFKKLDSEAQRFEAKKNSKMASAAYNYAYEVKTGSTYAKEKATRLFEKYRAINRLENLYQNGQYKEAIEEYNKALLSDKNNSYLHAGLARCYVDNNSLAKKHFSNAIAIDSNNVQIYKWEAEYLKSRKEYPEALIACTNFLRYVEPYDPEINQIRSLMAICKGIELFKLEKTKSQSIDSFQNAKKYYDKYPEPYYYLSRLAIENSRNLPGSDDAENAYYNALKYADSSILKDPNFISSFIQKADVLLKKAYLFNLPPNDPSLNSEKEQALKVLDEAIEKNKKYTEAYIRRGKFYLDFDNTHQNRGYLSNAKNDFNAALTNWDLDSNNSLLMKAKWYRAQCNTYLGEEEEAIKDYEILEGKSLINDREFCVDYGFFLLRRRKDIEKAKTIFKKAGISPNAKYGLCLVKLRLDPNSLNSDKTEIENTLKQQSKETIRKDFTDLGMSKLLTEDPIKSILKNK